MTPGLLATGSTVVSGVSARVDQLGVTTPSQVLPFSPRRPTNT